MSDRIHSRTRRRLATIAVCAGLLSISHSSYADEAPSTGAPTDEAMAEGRRQFQAGVNLLDDPDGARYEEAYHAFHKAYALSKSPKVLGNIGFCSLKLERDGEAIDAYTAYLRESPDVDPRERAQIERDLSTLTSTVGTVRLSIPKAPGSYVVADTRLQTRGSPVLNSYAFQGSELTVRLRPGRHTLKLKANDSESLPWEVTIEPNTRTSHEFTFAAPVQAAPAPTSSGPSYTGPVLLGLLGIAGLGAGVTTGLIARSKEADISDRCQSSICPSEFDLRSARTETKTYATIADISMIGGGAALAGAIVWAIALPSRSSKTPRTGSLTWSPSCGTRACGVQLGGNF
jgi:hypothetical protein